MLQTKRREGSREQEERRRERLTTAEGGTGNMAISKLARGMGETGGDRDRVENVCMPTSQELGACSQWEAMEGVLLRPFSLNVVSG